MKLLRNGFTLIELLVVITIIGILSTISVVTFSNYQHQAKDARTQVQINQIAKIIQADMASKGSNRYTDEYVASSNGADRIIEALDRRGASLPDPSENCYLILILNTYKGVVVDDTSESGIAVVAYRSNVDTSVEVDPSDTRDFNRYMIASGDNNAMDVLTNLDTYSNDTLMSWPNRLRSNMETYKSLNCQRNPVYIWNGAAVDSAPLHNVFYLVPLDPSLAPS